MKTSRVDFRSKTVAYFGDAPRILNFKNSGCVPEMRYSLDPLVLFLRFLGSGLLLFGFFLSGLFLGDRFLALESGGSRCLGRLDQLFGSFYIVRKRSLLLFGKRSHKFLEFLQSWNRLRNCIRRAEVGNAELVVGLSHLWVVFDGLLESVGGFLGPAPVCQHCAKIVIALARAWRIQLCSFL